MESIFFSGLLLTMLASLLAFATVRSQNTNLPPVIVESPKSLLVPVNTNAAFTCQAYCITSCSIYWIINGTTVNHIQRSNFEQKFGFSFSYQESNNMTYTVGLTIRASVNVNNTKLQCEAILHTGSHDTVKSSHAKLLVLTESPIYPNPSISTQSNCTLFLLRWSPPFLWPGHRIQSYDITVADTSNDSSIDLDMLNATFIDTIVSYVYPIHNIRSQVCHTELLFGVAATNDYAEILSTFYVQGQHPATVPREFFNSSINISILFTTSLIPIVSLSIQLPEPLCRFQELNYTILISDENGSIIAESGPYHQLVMGSELNMAGVVSHDVSSGLLRNEEYSLNVILFTFACESTSDSYYFDTNFEGDLTREACEFDINSQLSYQITTGVLLGGFLLTFLALLVVLLTFTVSKKQHCSAGKGSKTRSPQSMVHNPIYSGPDYESIHPQYETLQLVPHHMAHSTPGAECGNQTLHLQS